MITQGIKEDGYRGIRPLYLFAMLLPVVFIFTGQGKLKSSGERNTSELVSTTNSFRANTKPSVHESAAVHRPKVTRPDMENPSNAIAGICTPSSAATWDMTPKNRFLSITAGDSGQSQAIRVTYTNLPLPFDIWNTSVLWAGAPREICENSGQDHTQSLLNCGDAPGTSGTFITSSLRCTPFYMDWSTIGLFHISHEGIVPSGTYTVDVIDIACVTSVEANFSDPLLVNTSIYGDINGDGILGIAFDVTPIFDKFVNALTGPTKALADLGPRVVDHFITTLELTMSLDAFTTMPYPFAPSESILCDGVAITCGDEILDVGEQCDNGAANSDITPDACRANCTDAGCGDRVMDSGEQCDDGNTANGDRCSSTCQLEPLTGDAILSLVPVGNDPAGGLDPGVVLSGSQITLSEGGHLVLFDIILSDWDLGATFIPLDQWSVKIDGSGYSSGPLGMLQPATVACSTNSDCTAILGNGSVCDGVTCTSVFIDGLRPDYVFPFPAIINSSKIVDQSTPSPRYTGYSPSTPAFTPGTDSYLGTLAIDVPTDAAGTFTVGFELNVNTIFLEPDGTRIPLGGLSPAVIVVNADCCLPGGSCSSALTAQECADAGGSAIPACAGVDANMNGIDDACETCTPALPVVPDIRKLRYLAFNVVEGGQKAISVIFEDLPPPFDIANGLGAWVGAPVEVCENSGQNSNVAPVNCGPTMGSDPNLPGPTYFIANLTCVPVYLDWSILGDKPVNVYDEFIVPGATYSVAVVDITCPFGDPSSFSSVPVQITTPIWGDLVGKICTSFDNCSPPDGALIFINDVAAVLEMLNNTAFAPGKARADVEPGNLDQKINFTDVVQILGAFGGVPYPFSAPSSPCGGGGAFPPPPPPTPTCRCGNGIIECVESCDDSGESASCNDNCTLVVCGDGTLNRSAGEQCDDGNIANGDDCDANCLIEFGDAVFSLVPVGNGPSGTLDAGVTINGSEITLPNAGHQIFFDIMLSGWGLSDPARLLRSYQVAIDSTGYSSGMSGTLIPFTPACATSSDCTTLLGSPSSCIQNSCTAGFVDQFRSDYVFLDTGFLPGVNLTTLNYQFGAIIVTTNFVADAGTPVYLGTLVLDVPLDTFGTFTIDFIIDGLNTQLVDSDTNQILFAPTEPAVITILTDCCLPDSCASGFTESDCILAGGMPTAVCANADINGNGIDDACEVVACCVGGTCSLESPSGCMSLGGVERCDCLDDINPTNGVNDACETCSPASIPLALLDDPTKNRYISFIPSNTGTCTAYQVELTDHLRCSITQDIICEISTDCPAGESCQTTGCAGTSWWVGKPIEVDDRGETLYISRLSDQPVYRNWTEPVIHVGDFQIVPAAGYAVRAIHQTCNILTPTDFSSDLFLITTPKPTSVQWGNVVGIKVGNSWTAPNNFVNSDDLRAVIDGFHRLADAPSLVRLDLVGSVPDILVDIRDILAVLRIFSGVVYGGASPCDTPLSAQSSGTIAQTSSATISCVLVDPTTGDPLPFVNSTEEPSFPVYSINPNKIVDLEVFISNLVGEVGLYQIVVDFETAKQNLTNDTTTTCVPDVTPHIGNSSLGPNCDEGNTDLDVFINKAHENSSGTRDWIFDALSNSDSQTECSVPVFSNGSTQGTSILPAPEAYLGTFRLDLPVESGGNIYKVLYDNTSDVANNFFSVIAKNEFTPLTKLFFTNVTTPCAQIRVAFDCNENNVNDVEDIANSTSQDCNGNNIPDECEISGDGTNGFYCQESCIGCPEICDQTGCTLACDPDCNNNNIPDSCDLVACAPNDPNCADCNENCIPDSCDIANCPVNFEGSPNLCGDCNGNLTPDGCDLIVCTDRDGVQDCNDCDGDQLLDECESSVAEQDCLGKGICNACRIDPNAVVNGLTCSSAFCNTCGSCCGASSDCQLLGIDGDGIPDECDIADCPEGEADCMDCNANEVPDWCDIEFCMGDPCCDDCNNNSHPDTCDLDTDDPDGDGFTSPDCQPNAIPDECDLVSGGGSSFDINTNNQPDECDIFDPSLGLVCDVCTGIEDCVVGGPFPAEGTDNVMMGATFTLDLFGSASLVTIQAPHPGIENAMIHRGQPHLHGDASFNDDEPCLTPVGFPSVTSAGQEVHLEITSLDLNGIVSLWNDIFEVNPAQGEVQGTCLNFPAESYFNLFVKLSDASLPADLHNETPLLLRSQLPDFNWNFSGNPQSLYVNDHQSPAVPVFDDNGIQRGYIVRSQLGTDTFPAGSDSCEAALPLPGSVSFVVTSQTNGVVIDTFTDPITNPITNEINTDSMNPSRQVTVSVYQALGTGGPENGNTLVSFLAGITDGQTGAFISGDVINSLSFGRDGTMGSSSPLVYFSLSGADNAGVDCSDTARKAIDGTINKTGGDIYMAAGKSFGSFTGPLAAPCPASHINCLASDHSAIGLGPIVLDVDTLGQADNMIAMELSAVSPGDFVYLTFGASGGELVGEGATIFVHNTANEFRQGNLNSYVDLIMEGILLQNDNINALSVSDVGVLGIWDDGDSILFSLAPFSNSLNCGANISTRVTPAHIYRVRFGDSTPIANLQAFMTPGNLGLSGSCVDFQTSFPNVDAIDVGAAKELASDCNNNAIEDACDLARNASENAAGTPLECTCSYVPTAIPALSECCSDTGNGSNVRVLSFTAGEPGRRQAIRVTAVDLPPPFEYLNGTSRWVSMPKEICENSGNVNPDAPAGCGPTGISIKDRFWAASLECHTGSNGDLPIFIDWHGVCDCQARLQDPSLSCEAGCGVCVGGFKPGATCSVDVDCLETLHVRDPFIIPTSWKLTDDNPPLTIIFPAFYQVDVVDSLCSFQEDANYSPALPIRMSQWGDVTGGCDPDTGICSPPDGTREISVDVITILDTFRNNRFAISKIRADINPIFRDNQDTEPDASYWTIDFVDVVLALDAFRSITYPSFVPPSACD